MKISDWKIGTRLGLGFAIISILMIVVAFIGINRLANLNGDMNTIVKDRTPKVAMCNTLLLKLSDVRMITRNMLLATDLTKIKAEADRIPPISKIMTENLDLLEKGLTSEQEVALFKPIAELRAKYRDGLVAFTKYATEGKKEEASHMLNVVLPATLGPYNEALNKITDYEVSLMNKAGADAETEYQRSRVVIMSLTAAALLLAMMIAYFATRSITRPMNEAVQIAQTVAKGDLTSRIVAKTKDETGQLIQALKEMNDGLMQVCSQVRSGTATIAMASSQIAAGNQDLSSRTEQQASSLEETASSMEQLTSTVKQNGDNAHQANQLAISASDIAVKGGAVVSEVVQTMGSINESSRKIVDIISVIDGIAFQTNILALNAAVEAARAGEQGRGFAVVASEVRNLAQRSAGAAKEIKVLIDDSVEKVATGSRLVDQAGTTMDEIVGSIRRVTDIMGEITAATREQVDGIEQINQAVTDMDSVTQQNAALVEEAAAAAESLQGQANNLVQVVSRFHTGEGAAVATALPAPPPPRAALDRPAAKAPPRRAVEKVTAASLNAPVRTSVAFAGAQGDEWEQF